MAAQGGEAFAALAAQVHELGLVCDRLSRENAELRDQVSRLAGAAGPPRGRRALPQRGQQGARQDGALHGRIGQDGAPDGRGGLDGARDGRVSRRMVGKALGVAAVGAAGAAALPGLSTAPAAAANGDPVTAGQATAAETRTSVLYDGPSGFTGVVLLGNDSTHDGGSANFPAGAGGWAGAGSTAGAGRVANGVYGFSDNGDGNGVVGYNSNFVTGSGAGVLGLAFGANAVAVRGTNTVGTAVAGSSGDTTANATAVLGTIASPSPGEFSAGVKGQNNSGNGRGIGVWGSHNGSGWGLYGTSGAGGIGVNAACPNGTGMAAAGGTAVIANGGNLGVVASGHTALVAEGGGPVGIGVSATADSSAPAVQAANSGTGSGVRGTSKLGRGGIFGGAAAQLKLLPGTRTTHPGNGQRGDLYADSKGRLWYCKTGGTRATWHQVA
jgi:hypothetical protein